MSADRLKEAARVLRERAGAATPGPWTSDASWIENDGAIVAIGFRGNKVSDDPNADFIATMHPGVALALADWLDEAGADYFAFGDDEHHAVDHEPCDECDSDPRAPHLRHALTVADLILGDDR